MGYILGFRSLNCDFYKAPGSNFGYILSTKQAWIPEPPKEYGSDGNRKVIITFKTDIQHFYSSSCKWSEFPIIEAPNLQYLTLQNIRVQTIPFNRFAGMSDLISLNIRSSVSIDKSITQFPESLKECKKLTTFVAVDVFDFSNLEESGLRETIKQMKSLQQIQFRNCNLDKYIKEFNELPDLRVLFFGTNYRFPDFSEVDKINPSIIQIGTGSTWGNGTTVKKFEGDPTGWMEWYNKKGMENVNYVEMYSNYQIMDLEFLPEWIYEARNLKTLPYDKGFRYAKTSEYIDTYINTIYQETIKHPMSQIDTDGKRNQWYGLNLLCWEKAEDCGVRPSGKLQAPTGFIKGEDNGNPTTGLEKIYVLENNYNQKWTIKPE